MKKTSLVVLAADIPTLCENVVVAKFVLFFNKNVEGTKFNIFSIISIARICVNYFNAKSIQIEFFNYLTVTQTHFSYLFFIIFLRSWSFSYCCCYCCWCCCFCGCCWCYCCCVTCDVAIINFVIVVVVNSIHLELLHIYLFFTSQSGYLD